MIFCQGLLAALSLSLEDWKSAFADKIVCGADFDVDIALLCPIRVENPSSKIVASAQLRQLNVSLHERVAEVQYEYRHEIYFGFHIPVAFMCKKTKYVKYI